MTLSSIASYFSTAVQFLNTFSNRLLFEWMSRGCSISSIKFVGSFPFPIFKRYLANSCSSETTRLFFVREKFWKWHQMSLFVIHRSKEPSTYYFWIKKRIRERLHSFIGVFPCWCTTISFSWELWWAKSVMTTHTLLTLSLRIPRLRRPM